MAIIHKLVESGAEAYLPFLLAREREIRRKRSDNSDGSMSGGYAVKYELGDGIEGELRMVGNQSFISLRMGASIGFEWIAYLCKIAPVVFESAAHATTPAENRPTVEKLPFVAIPRVPYPTGPVEQTVTWPGPFNGTPTYVTLPCTSGGFPAQTPQGVGTFSSATFAGIYYNQDTSQWGMDSVGAPMYDEFGNLIGYGPPVFVPSDMSGYPYFSMSAHARLGPLGLSPSSYALPSGATAGTAPAVMLSAVVCNGSLAELSGSPYPWGPGLDKENATYDYIVAKHAAHTAYVSALATYTAQVAAVDAQNAVIDAQNAENYNLWLGENDAPMIAKKNTECDAWDAPLRAGRKAFMESLFTSVLAETEDGFTTKWLTEAVLSPAYPPVGPVETSYFIRRISSSMAMAENESGMIETVVYGITGPDGMERIIEGTKTETYAYGPATECYTLSGDDYQSSYSLFGFSNYWLGDPANDMRDMFPSSTKRGRGYLVSGTTTRRTENKFLHADLTEIDLAEAVAFDAIGRRPSVAGEVFLDTGFVDGCQVSIVVLRYMMWDAGADARVPVVGYTNTMSSLVCQSGNCLDSNFITRLPAPRNAANEVWLESVITMTKSAGQWSAPAVTKFTGVLLCPIAIDNTPRENVYEQVTLGIPFAEFPDFVVVVRGMPVSYIPKDNALAAAFTGKFSKLAATEASVPPAIDCTTVAQMRDRITLEAIKQSNL